MADDRVWCGVAPCVDQSFCSRIASIRALHPIGFFDLVRTTTAASRQPFGEFFSGVDAFVAVVFFLTVVFFFAGVAFFFVAVFFVGLVAVGVCFAFKPSPALTRLRARLGLSALAAVAFVVAVALLLGVAMMLLLWLGVVFADPNTGSTGDT